MNLLALLMIVVGIVVGTLAVVRPPDVRRKIAIGLVAYLLLAVGTGVYAAFRAVAVPQDESGATMLARGIAETMNCGAYGVVAGLASSALVAASRRLLR